MSGAEIGPNDIIIHLVNPYKCLDCGTEFFQKNSFLQHLVEHMDKLKSQHPCYQIVCGVNLAAQQPNSITVTKDILQINGNQMFELQDSSVDYTQLPPLKTLEQAGILRLPPPEKVMPTSLPKLHTNQPLAINLTSQPILQQGVTQQNISVTQGQAGSNDNMGLLSKSCDEKHLDSHSHIDLNNLQNLQPADTTPVELQTLVQQALMESSGIKEELSVEVDIIPSKGYVQEKNNSAGRFNVIPKIDASKVTEPWPNANNMQSLAGVKHVMVFKEMPDTISEISDSRVECKICFNRFASKNVLMRHQVVHSGEKPHCCFKCFKQFNDISSLAKHVKIHKRSHQCPVCLKMFLRRRQMELHLGQHKKKRFIQFGHKYHEVQVSTSRNSCDQIVHEYSLSVLLKKKGDQLNSSAVTPQESSALVENKTQEEKTGTKCVQNLNTVHQPETIPSENIFPFQTLNALPDNSVSGQHESLSMYKVIYRCGHCKKHINTRPTLSRHLMLHTNEKPFRCEQCGKQFRHKSDLVHHYKTHSKPVKCLTCGSAFSKELYLQNHLQKGCPFLESDNEKFVVLPDLSYQCNLCNKVLKTKANIVRHLRVHAFNNKESDSKKISKNVSESGHDSKDGGHAVISSGNANDYIKPLDSSVGFLCTLCNEKFRFKSFILIHVRMHLGQRLFKCKECGKGFFGRYMLRKHEQNHTRPYKCPKCGKGFNRRYLMAHHFNKSHNEEAEDKMKDITFLLEDKLLCCDICGKTMQSYQKSLMQYHIRLHKDVRPHQCKVCQKTFISVIALKKHSLNHSKPYMCGVCDRGFSRRYLMLDHFDKNCKYKLEKQEKQTVQDEGTEEVEKDILIKDATNQVIVLQSEEECVAPMSPSEPYHAEIVTELDEAKGIEVYRCAPCDKTFTVRDALSRHIKTFMRSTPCKYCKTSFEDKHLTRSHQRSCLGVDIKVKTQCKSAQTMGEKQEKVLKTMKEMSSKIESLTAVLHTDSTNTQEVVTANAETKNDQGSTSTISTSSSDKIKTASSMNQQTNLETLHTVTNKTIAIFKEGSTYQCPNCAKSFGTPRGLKIHAASHVRLYKCEMCGQDFTQVGKFRLHLKSHEVETQEYNENESDYGFNNTTNNNSNLKKQSNKKETSPKGSKPSSENGKLKKILDVDKTKMDAEENGDKNGEESSNDLIEGKSTGLKMETVSLRLMQTGTRGRPFSCQMCRRRFTEESGLEFHLSHIHGVK